MPRQLRGAICLAAMLQELCLGRRVAYSVRREPIAAGRDASSNVLGAVSYDSPATQTFALVASELDGKQRRWAW